MVTSINAIDPTLATQAVIPVEDMVTGTQTNPVNQQETQPVTTDSFQTSNIAFADYQIREYVIMYVNNLISRFDGNDDIISRLRSYLGNFNIDHFKQTFTNISSNADLSMALYNDTLKFLY